MRAITNLATLVPALPPTAFMTALPLALLLLVLRLLAQALTKAVSRTGQERPARDGRQACAGTVRGAVRQRIPGGRIY